MATSIDLFAGLVGVLVCVVQGAIWRIRVTLFVLEPVVAQLAGSDYREADRNFDGGVRRLGPGMGTHSPFSLIEDETRPTDTYWHYTDLQGTRHEITLSSFGARGVVPDGVRMLWIDPADPARVTRRGPGFWAICAIAAATALGWLLWNGPETLARLIGAAIV